MPRDLYSAAFDFSALGLGTVSGANAAVFASGLTGNVGFTSGVFFHGDTAPASTLDGVTFAYFKVQVLALLAGAGKALSYDPVTNRYTISATSNFTVTWSGAQGAALQAILGFSGNLSGTNTYTSDRRPRYTIISRLNGQSQVRELYEPSGRIAYAESDNGQAFSTHPVQLPLYRDWSQPFETLTGPTNAEFSASPSVGGAPLKITDVGIATSVRWSWQDFFTHCRATLPFMLIDRQLGGTGPIYKLRGDAAHFDPTRVTADYDGHWTIPLATRYLGDTI